MFNAMKCKMYVPLNPWQWYYFFMPKKEYYAFEAYFQIESLCFNYYSSYRIQTILTYDILYEDDQRRIFPNQNTYVLTLTSFVDW